MEDGGLAPSIFTASISPQLEYPRFQLHKTSQNVTLIVTAPKRVFEFLASGTDTDHKGWLDRAFWNMHDVGCEYGDRTLPATASRRWGCTRKIARADNHATKLEILEQLLAIHEACPSTETRRTTGLDCRT